MTGWVRLWEDMPTDPKWQIVRSRALRNVSGVSICMIVSVFTYMLTKADKNGEVTGWDNESAAVLLEISEAQVEAIYDAMQGKVLDGNRLKSWEKRQPNGNDISTKRVRAFRERRNALKRDMKRNETTDYTRLEEKKVARAREAPSEVVPRLGAPKWPTGRMNGHATEDAVMPTKFTPAELERHKETHKIYVKRETPAGEAWANWTQKNTGHSQVWDAKGGWHFPSEWPPPSPSVS